MKKTKRYDLYMMAVGLIDWFNVEIIIFILLYNP